MKIVYFFLSHVPEAQEIDETNNFAAKMRRRGWGGGGMRAILGKECLDPTKCENVRCLIQWVVPRIAPCIRRPMIVFIIFC